MKFGKFIDEISQDNPNTIEFIFYFARFEYALKREGFLKNNKFAEPCWDTFFKSCDSKIEPILGKLDLSYLFKYPPRKQTVSDGVLSWEDMNLDNLSDANKINLIIRAIRNNLLHGGKFPEMPIDEISRNKKLITSALDTIKALSKIDPINKHFDKID